MTIETKTTVELSDIKTVEFECRNCHSISLWPLDVAKSPPISCHCDGDQWMTHGGDMFASITRLIELMQRFSKTTKEPFVMRFGLAPSVHASGGKG